MSNPRLAKLADQIKEIVANTILLKVKDPRLTSVTITEVRLSGDGQQATIFYTVLADEAGVADAGAALASANGMLRSTVGGQLGIRTVPTLTFVQDASAQTAQDMEELLARAQAADAEVAAKRTGADFAGDPDPYRSPEADETTE